MEFQTLKDRIIHILQEVMQSVSTIEDPPPVLLEYARDERFGDYACTIAMDKDWRHLYSQKNPEYKNPRAFATAILEALQENKQAKIYIEKAEIAGPGFINITVSQTALFESLLESVQKAEKYGQTITENPEKIIFEFVSANPTGPLNVVSARAAALGDSCCNLLEAAGHNVHREFYVNDFGNQVNLLGISCLYRYFESQGIALNFAIKNQDGSLEYSESPGLLFPAEGYHGDYLTEIVQQTIENNPHIVPDEETVSRARELASQVNRWDLYDDAKIISTAAQFGQAATEQFLKRHQADLERFRVNFDRFYSEKSLHDSGAVLSVAGELQDHTYSEEGKTFFRSTDYSDDKDRVIIRDDGRPTYLLADIAYHKTKIDRGFDKIYNIWGPDHHGYIKRLAGAVDALGYPPEHFSILIAQQVNLLDEGKPVVMSKRTGRFITLETLIEEIPVDVSRYFFVMRSFESHLDFDFTEARDTSEKNPYYYVAYAHARIRSIMSRASEEKRAPLPQNTSIENIPTIEMTSERRRLLWLISRFPEEVRDAANSIEPHRLINFVYLVATALSKFYAPRENRIIESDQQTAALLLTLLEGTAHCLKNGLRILGMEAPERLKRDKEETGM